MIDRVRAFALTALVAFGWGFITAWLLRRPRPIPPLIVGTAKPLPEQNLSPVGQVRTVIVTKVIPGPPAAPPVPVPADLGVQLSTTTTALPALPQGTTFDVATFAKLDGSRLQLRQVEWARAPDGSPVSLGQAQTVESVQTLNLPPIPPVPHWSALLLATSRDGRFRPGGQVQHTWGPVELAVGYLDDRAFVGGGFTW